MNDVKKDLNRLWLILLLGYGLILIVSVSAFLFLSHVHHNRLANSFAMAARSSLVIHDLRQAILTLNPAIDNSFEIVVFRSPNDAEVFTLPSALRGEEVKSGFTTVRFAIPIYQNPDLKDKTLGTLDFYFDSTKSMSWLGLIWLIFLALAWPVFWRARRFIEQRHQEVVLIKQAEAASAVAKQVAHDIRSPLSALKIFAQKRRGSLSEDDFGLISNVTERIVKISDDLLEKSRAVMNAQNTIATLLLSTEKTIAEKRLLHPQAHIEFQFEPKLEAAKDRLKVDLYEWMTCISNLIENAIEASAPHSGRVVLTLKIQNRAKLVFACTDHGRGIQPEILAQILKSGGSFGKDRGNGLGLSPLRRIVQTAGGTWTMTSEFGHGATVSFELPLAPPA